MVERLAIVPAQVKAGNTSENLLNAICQTVYSFFWENKFTKKVCNNIMNSIKL